MSVDVTSPSRREKSRDLAADINARASALVRMNPESRFYDVLVILREMAAAVESYFTPPDAGPRFKAA